MTAACADTPEESDGIDDSFTGPDSKADTAGILEGSRQAKGVLRVTNELSLEELDENPPDGVGLDRRIVNNVANLRLGDDGLPGTADDGRFDTLAELDAVPYVGPIAFKKLLRYAETNGYIEHGTIVNGTSDRPATLVAYRDGIDGAWLPAKMKSPTSFEIEVDAAYILAVVCEDTANGSVTTIEIGQFADEGDVVAYCGFGVGSVEPQHSISGRMAQAGRVTVGSTSRTSSVANWDFQLLNTDGTYDLVAATADAVALRRGIVLAGDTTLAQPIDVTQEGAALVASPLTVTNATGTETLFGRISLRPQANALATTLYQGEPANAKAAPPSVLVSTDRQRASVTGIDGKFTRALYRNLGGGSFTLPAPLPAPFWSVEGGELQVRFPAALTGDYFYIDAWAYSADGAKSWYHDIELSKRFVAETARPYLGLDTKIPGYKAEWKIDFAKEFGRDVYVYGFGAAETTVVSYSETVNAPTARLASPVSGRRTPAQRLAE